MSRINVNPSKVSQRLSQPYAQHATGDGATTTFFLDRRPTVAGGLLVFEDGLCKRPDADGTPHDYAVSDTKVTFAVAPAAGAALLFFILSV